MARKTKEEALKTREGIIEAAIELFLKKGVSRASLSDIAKRAGVTRGAIYWHFKNKEDLLEALWTQLLLPFEPLKIACENPEEADPLGKLRQAYIEYFRALKDDPRMMKILRILLDKYEMVHENGNLSVNRLMRYHTGQQRIEEILQNAMRKGQLPGDHDVRLGSIATISFIDGLSNNCIMFPDDIDIDHKIPSLLDGLFIMLRQGCCRSRRKRSTSSPRYSSFASRQVYSGIETE